VWLEDWVDARLAERGLSRTAHIALHHDRPWSSVWRVPTTGGVHWLKRNGPGTRYEPALLRVLATSGAAGVPDLLGADARRGWSLTADAGSPLRALPAGEDTVHWEHALRRYARIQRRLESSVDVLLARGVPDHRPRTAAHRAEALLADGVAMRRGLSGGLTPDTENRVRAMLPRLADWGAELAASPVPVTIQHDDLHANNVLLDQAGRMTVIDWGDAQVAHPFATLLTTMRSIAHHTGLAGPDDPQLEPLRDAYLEAWADVADLPRLRNDAALAVRIAPVARAHSWHRALRGASRAALDEHGEAVPGWLSEVG
jgi:hypothetical protein